MNWLRSAFWSTLACLPLSARRHILYMRAHRTVGNFRHPRKFSEKVNRRIILDRSESLTWTCDKLAMKEHARELAPNVLVPATLWVGTDVGELATVTMPDRWILKANHRSQAVHIGQGKPDVEILQRITEGWLEQREGELLGEWAYLHARPLLFVEEWIGTETSPPDYKFFVFGEAKVVQVDASRFNGHHRHVYSREWESIDVRNAHPVQPSEEPPEHLAEMLEIADAIGSAFDFMRVDLYDTPAGVYFGETTPYPAGGLEPFEPMGFDRELGQYWTPRA